VPSWKKAYCLRLKSVSGILTLRTYKQGTIMTQVAYAHPATFYGWETQPWMGETCRKGESDLDPLRSLSSSEIGQSWIWQWFCPLWLEESSITWGSLWEQRFKSVPGIVFILHLPAASGLFPGGTECFELRSCDPCNFPSISPGSVVLLRDAFILEASHFNVLEMLLDLRSMWRLLIVPQIPQFVNRGNMPPS
jgi:hypothetical protein